MTGQSSWFFFLLRLMNSQKNLNSDPNWEVFIKIKSLGGFKIRLFKNAILTAVLIRK